MAMIADEHERRADHREQEELGGGVDAVAVAPPPDEEVHRHEHDLEADEEQEEVERRKVPMHAGLEQQDPRGVGLLVVVALDAEQREREQDAGEHDEEQRDAVDAEVPRDARAPGSSRACVTNWKPPSSGRTRRAGRCVSAPVSDRGERGRRAVHELGTAETGSSATTTRRDAGSEHERGEDREGPSDAHPR